MTSFKLSVALDFGSRYSGYAYSLKEDYDVNPMDICTNQAWNAGEQQLLSMKTPTCILIDDKKRFKSFGFEAENIYKQLMKEKTHTKYYYFENFKMMLYKSEVTIDMMLKDKTGNKLQAVTVFGLSIWALKEHFLKTISDRPLVNKVKNQEIIWVLTVPAIWGAAAKEFMREAAHKADIPDGQLLVVLEPEAASIYCQHLPLDRFPGDNQKKTRDDLMTEGVNHMVVDLGGGTVDIAIHEKMRGNHIKQKYKSCGNASGGNVVKEKFMKTIVDVFGKEVAGDIEENTDLYMELMRAFEIFKRSIPFSATGFVEMQIPALEINAICKKRLGKDMENVVSECTGGVGERVKLDLSKLAFRADLAVGWFEETSNEIITLMEKVMRESEVTGLTYILLVGGFSECSIVREKLKRHFLDKKFIIPQYGGLAVLKGAVIYGHQPDIISARILNHTYGVEITPVFNPAVHDQKKKQVIDGVARCKYVFLPLITIGTETTPTYSVEKSFKAAYKRQSILSVKVFVSDRKSVSYVTERQCNLLGEVRISVPNPTDDPCTVSVKFHFGNNVVNVVAIDEKTKIKYEAKFHLKSSKDNVSTESSVVANYN